MGCYCLWKSLKSGDLIRGMNLISRPKSVYFGYITRNFSRTSSSLQVKSKVKVYDSISSSLLRMPLFHSRNVFVGKRPTVHFQQAREMSGKGGPKFNLSERHKSVALYTLSLAILVCGGSYAAVPLYRLYCQASGYGGTVKVTEVGEKLEKMEKQQHRMLTVKFNADKNASMQWDFKPRQSTIKIVPGETALAFYTAKNPTDQPITGVSTYNVIPFEAGQYFNKIQCFCFEEQRLNPGEEVDMPVFFYIDPEFVDDPSLRKVTELTLSYTFFEAKDGSWPDLNVPVGMNGHGKA